jgi:formylglycine-generating enzyme required for sulfatase activity
MGHDVFISHSSHDKIAADAVCAALGRAGVRCWVAPRDILPGDNWAKSILAAIGSARMMVLIFSKNTQASQHIRREVERAVHHGIPIAPIRIDDVMPAEDLEYYLSSSHWMDAMTPPFERHLAELSRTVKALLSEPATAQAPRSTGSNADGSPRPTPDRPLHAASASGRDPISSTRRLRPELLLLVVVLLCVAGWFALSRFPDRMPWHTAAQRADPNSTPQASRNSSHPLVADGDPHDLMNSLGMKFVVIPGDDRYRPLGPDNPGHFLMGSPQTEFGRDKNEPQHRVTLTHPFLMGATHVTRGQFAAFVQGSGYHTDAEKQGSAYLVVDGKFWPQEGASWRNVGFRQTDDDPVVIISWNDATTFAEWLSKRDGRRYRLPTEAEWEYACRAGTQTAYLWGDDPEAGAGWANAADASLKRQVPDSTTFSWDDGYVYTSPVGRFRPNAFGLFDNVGNAWQWCSDWYGTYPAGDAVDPAGPAQPPTGTEGFKVLRGGSWNTGGPGDCRAAGRLNYKPDHRINYVGFRLCIEY